MKVQTSIELPFSAEKLWNLAGGYDLLPLISSATAMSRLEDGGRVRVLVNRDGSILWERLLAFDEAARTLSYLITDAKGFLGAYGPGYRGRVTVEAIGPSSAIFHYAADFEPAPGVSEDQARAAVLAFADDCAGGMRRVLSLPSFS